MIANLPATLTATVTAALPATLPATRLEVLTARMPGSIAPSQAYVASLPSPSFNSIDIGPLSLNIYGLAIALGVVAAVWMFGRRLEQRGAGTADDASSIGVWAVLAGVIGARLYHVATDWDRFTDNYGAIPKLWEGGLGIPGGLALGIPTGLYLARAKGISMPMAATCAAPAIALAQAIGRWGNYFNQELYGRPTDLPWALEIDDAHLLQGFASGTTFHPTFLYESLWSLALCAVLLWIDRKYRPDLGQLMAMYIMGYGAGRFWVEGLRIDRADEIAGLRWNQWVAIAAVVGGGLVLALMRRNPSLEAADPFLARRAAVAAEAAESIDAKTPTDPTGLSRRGAADAAASTSSAVEDVVAVADDDEADISERLVALDDELERFGVSVEEFDDAEVDDDSNG